jgi:hypothetical protein
MFDNKAALVCAFGEMHYMYIFLTAVFCTELSQPLYSNFPSPPESKGWECLSNMECLWFKLRVNSPNRTGGGGRRGKLRPQRVGEEVYRSVFSFLLGTGPVHCPGGIYQFSKDKCFFWNRPHDKCTIVHSIFH